MKQFLLVAALFMTTGLFAQKQIVWFDAGLKVQYGASGFYSAAIEEATDLINADASKYTSLLSDKGLVPPPLLETFKVPPFPAKGIPTEEEWNDALAWAKEKGMLTTDISYADSVNGSLLP